jgi:hypothetical protein
LKETERYEEMVRIQQDGDDGGGAGRKCLIINQTKVTTSVPYFFEEPVPRIGKSCTFVIDMTFHASRKISAPWRVFEFFEITDLHDIH